MVQCLRRREAGIVVVVQTNQELVLASKAEMFHSTHLVADVEAMAAVRAIAFARELGLPCIIIEEDFEVIIKALRSEEESFVSSGHLIANAIS